MGDWDFPFDKPANTWCRHCAPGHGGCKIWATGLPNLCRSYLCLWKLTGEEQILPEWCRPDKIRAIFHPIKLPEFPNDRIMEVLCEPNRELDPRLVPFLERGADLGMSFLIGDGASGGALSNNPEISKALEVYAQARGAK